MAKSCIMCDTSQTKHFIRAKLLFYGFIAMIVTISALESSHRISARLEHAWLFELAVLATSASILGYCCYVVYRCADWLLRQQTACTRCQGGRCASKH